MKRKIKKYTKKIKLNNKIYKSKKLKTNKSKKLKTNKSKKIKTNKSKKIKTNKSKKIKTNKSKKIKTNKSIIIFLIDTNKIKKMKGGSTLQERSLAFKKLEKTSKKIKKDDESKITEITYDDNIEQMINDVKEQVDILSDEELKPSLEFILLDLVELVGEARVASNAANYLIRHSSPFIKFIIESLNDIADSTLYTLDDVKPEIFIIQTTLSKLKKKLNEIKNQTLNDTT